MFEYPANSLGLYRSLFFNSEPRANQGRKTFRQRNPQLCESPLKEVQHVVRTIALFAPVRSASAPGYSLVLLCTRRQSASGNGFVAVVSSSPGTLLNDYRHPTSCAHQRLILGQSYRVCFLCHFLSFGINAR